jgi:hypothetical protein
MKTLRASKGNTSSGVTFWLMAAMRMKDRSGPGIMTVSIAAAEGGVPFADLGWSFGWSFGWSGEEAALTPLPENAEEHTHSPTKVAVKMANVRRGRFIIGYLSETF